MFLDNPLRKVSNGDQTTLLVLQLTPTQVMYCLTTKLTLAQDYILVLEYCHIAVWVFDYILDALVGVDYLNTLA